MCGIAGIASPPGALPPPREAVRAMLRALVHRGPDDEGEEHVAPVWLGARRLSIIDLAGGRQPMSSADGRLRVAFNGEIYGFRELRKELEQRGRRFATESDTEVLLHGWAEHGAALPGWLDGMFAFALHDVARGRLLLARDPLGVKPLYWASGPYGLAFASEPKALLASGLVAADLDPDAAAKLLAWQYVPGERTLFSGIRRLPAGALLDVDLAALPRVPEPRRYWDVPDAPEEDRPREAWLGLVEQALEAAVARQQVADVPLGALLSGGIDSSLVVSAMRDPQTFHVGFDDPGWDERRFARDVARVLGARHREEHLAPHAGELFARLVELQDDPIADSSLLPTLKVAELARRHVKVVLGGDGGDELFAGYETHAAEGLSHVWDRLPDGLRRAGIEPWLRRLPPSAQKRGLANRVRRFLEGMEHDPALGHARWRLFAGAERLARLLAPGAGDALRTPVGAHVLAWSERARARDPVNRALYVDLKSYLCDDILAKVDRASMAVSLEARVPLLDRSLVELAFRIPGREKLRGLQGKRLLRRLAARRVSRTCARRAKQGFSAPMKNWLRGPLRPRLEDELSPDTLRREGLFDADEVARLLAEHGSGRADHGHLLYGLLVFQAWRHRWLPR